MPIKANIEIDGAETQITFDATGNPLLPKSEPDPELEPKIDEVEQAEARQVPFEQETNVDNDDNSDSNPSNPSNPSEPEQIMPDPSIGISDMNQYGYSADDMLPLTQSRVTELFDANHTVYLLYPDNTEALIFDRDEIMNHDGVFGIERNEWETSQECAATKAEKKISECSREAELLFSNDNRYGIYQVRDGPDLRDYRFASLEDMQTRGLDVSRSNYELVYTAPLTDPIEFLTDRYPVLNKIHDKFNLEHPDDYTGRSVSISDVIVLKYNNDISSHYVDRVGFVEIDAFLGEERTYLPGKKPVHEIETSKPETYSQAGNMSANERTAAPKGASSLIERLAQNKLKAAQQGQSEATKPKEREVVAWAN